jgi:glucose-6-phosphate dehydrogenase assembly protein OpcA
VEGAIAAAVHPDRILRELAELWVELGRGKGAQAGVLRACAMTLIVVDEDGPHVPAVRETLARLMRDHPSRLIAILVSPAPETALAARVFAECWLPFGKREQICCEQIEISAAETALADLPPVVGPLAAPDLPVFLWVRSPRLFGNPETARLSPGATKLLLDSSVAPDPARALAELVAQRRAGQRLADLAWTRLTRWRELIAQIFENPGYAGCIPHMAGAALELSGPAPPAQAFYLAAWIAACVRDAGGNVTCRFEPGPAGGAPGVSGVRLEFAGASARDVSIRMGAPGTAEIRVDGLENRTVFEAPNEYSLLREELSIGGPDPVWERIAGDAAKLARGSELLN